MSKLASLPEAERAHFAAPAQNQVVMPPSRHCNRSHASQRFDGLRRWFVDLVAMPEAPEAPFAKRIDEAVDAQHKAVKYTRRHCAHLHALQRLDGPRRALVFLVAVSKLAKCTPAKRVDGALLDQRQGVFGSHRDAGHAHRRQPRHHLRHRHHLRRAVAQPGDAVLVGAARKQPALAVHKRAVESASAHHRAAPRPLVQLRQNQRLRHRQALAQLLRPRHPPAAPRRP
eukprot:1802258-Prymnesium_polylepis.4